jgi:hypothetical protein
MGQKDIYVNSMYWGLRSEFERRLHNVWGRSWLNFGQAAPALADFWTGSYAVAFHQPAIPQQACLLPNTRVLDSKRKEHR